MSNLAKALLVVATLAVAYMIFRKVKGGPKPLTPPSTNGPQIGSGDLGTTGAPTTQVDVNYGCVSGSAYANTCTTINFTNPQSNMGCCGRQVYNFQVALNNYQAFGLEEDGKYGPATLQAHQAIRSQQAIPPDLPGVNFSF
jgi:hypothetical protein